MVIEVTHMQKIGDMLKREDFKKRKQLHDKILKFKNQQKVEKAKSEWENEETAFGRFESKLEGHQKTISRNEEMIRKMREKEVVYIDKLKQTLQKQKTLSEYSR